MGLLAPSNNFLDKGSPKNNYLGQKFSVGFAVHIPVHYKYRSLFLEN